MRILFVFNGPGLASTLSGGDVRFLEIARYFRSRGHEAHVLTTSGGARICRREGLDGPLRQVRASVRKEAETGHLDRMVAYLLSTLHSLAVASRLPDVDIVYSTSDFVCDTIPAWFLRATRPRLRWVAMSHHLTPLPGRRRGEFLVDCVSYLSQRLGFRLMVGEADRVFLYGSVEGERIAHELGRLGPVSDRIRSVANGIDYRGIASLPAREKVYDACFAGGVRPSKGLYDLVPIWRRVCGRRPGSRLAVIGACPEAHRVYLDRAIAESGLEGLIDLLGYHRGEALYTRMAGARIFIAPSHEEGWGISVCEAMACGLPVVAYDLPAYRSIYGSVIRVVPLPDRDAFGDAVCDLLEDPDLAAEQRRRGLATAAGYDWREIGARETGLLEEVLGTVSPPPQRNGTT